MRAIVMRDFGPPPVLVAAQVPDPRPRPGEALIEVQVANVTFVETQVRAGRPPHPSMLPTLPAVLGNGVGGVVSAIGAGADTRWLGRPVVASLGGTGGYAERAVANADQLIGIPPELGTQAAVALLADGRTALLLLQAAAIQPGEVVLVEAAAGGVGSLLVQLSRNAQARVVGLARGPRKLGVARDLGASAAVDYGLPGWADRLRAEIGNLDVVFDGVGGGVGRATFELVRPGGRFLPFGMSSGAFAQVDQAEARRRQVQVIRPGRPTPVEMRALVQAALAEALAGRVSPLIGQSFPLDQAAEAHAAIEARSTIGKTVLLV